MFRTGAVLMAAVSLLLGGCSDDSGRDASSAEQVIDGLSGEGGQTKLSIRPFAPASVTIAEKMLHDIHVLLTEPTPQEIYVDVVNKDPVTVSIPTSFLQYKKWDNTQMVTIQGIKENSQEVELVFTIRDTTETQTLKVKVVKMLPDAGVPSDL